MANETKLQENTAPNMAFSPIQRIEVFTPDSRQLKLDRTENLVLVGKGLYQVVSGNNLHQVVQMSWEESQAYLEMRDVWGPEFMTEALDIESGDEFRFSPHDRMILLPIGEYVITAGKNAGRRVFAGELLGVKKYS